jgi:ATP-dependent RNA helicase DDX5/DBP2
VQVTVGSLDLAANKDVTQIVNVCDDREKYSLLSRALKDYDNGRRILIFVETKKGCDMLQRSLRNDGWNCRSIHGDKSQQVRSGHAQACSTSV